MTTIEPSPEAVTRQLERLLASRHLRGSPGLSGFLTFVVKKTLAGQAGDVKEYTIAVEVMGRGPDYDSRSDGTVRVQAGALRKKLAAYYAEEGREDEIVIDVPKGGYVPVFTARPRPEVAAPAPKARSYPRWPLLLAAAATLALCAYVALRPSRGVPGVVWQGFLDGSAPTVLALGTPQFFSGGGVFVRDTAVNSADARGSSDRLRRIGETLGAELHPVEIYTGIGEANAAVTLAQMFTRHGQELRILRTRFVRWAEMKDANVVFVASMRFRSLADDLELDSDFAFSPAERGDFLNRRPQPGEPQTWRSSDRDEHAVITVWPGKSPGRRIMILRGRNTWGTQGAAEYVTRPEQLADLEARLEECRRATGAARHPDAFETVVHVEVKDGIPMATRYVTHHHVTARPR